MYFQGLNPLFRVTVTASRLPGIPSLLPLYPVVGGGFVRDCFYALLGFSSALHLLGKPYLSFKIQLKYKFLVKVFPEPQSLPSAPKPLYISTSAHFGAHLELLVCVSISLIRLISFLESETMFFMFIYLIGTVREQVLSKCLLT